MVISPAITLFFILELITLKFLKVHYSLISRVMVVFKDSVKIVSFDVGGTLVDNRYLDLVWNKAIPELYARKMNIDPESAKEYVLREYARVGDDDINWYSPEYWFKRFGLEGDPLDFFESFKDEVRIYPEVPSVLKNLSEKFLLIISTCTPRGILEVEIERIRCYFRRVFSSTSDFKLVRKTMEFYGRVCQAMRVSPQDVVHVGDDWNFDYLIPRKIGIRSFYLDRARRKKNDLVIKDLRELEAILLNT